MTDDELTQFAAKKLGIKPIWNNGRCMMKSQTGLGKELYIDGRLDYYVWCDPLTSGDLMLQGMARCDLWWEIYKDSVTYRISMGEHRGNTVVEHCNPLDTLIPQHFWLCWYRVEKGEG